jgi:hypothetical protein
MDSLDDLLQGAWDLHCHCYPELALEHRARQDDMELVQGLAAAGLAGVVLKSHFWPTPPRAHYLQRLVPGLRVLSSITLNHITGGLSPFAVDAAARLGAKVLFFPTWGSRNDIEGGGFSTLIRRVVPRPDPLFEAGLVVTDGGRLTRAAEAVLDVAAEFDLLVCTGHVSAAEGLLVCEGARRRGLQAVFSHPTTASIGASLDELRAAADLGAYVEFCCLHLFSPRGLLRPPQVAELMAAVGAEHCLLTTDTFGAWAPPAPELLRAGLGVLLDCGVGWAALRAMVADNPIALLGTAATAPQG